MDEEFKAEYRIYAINHFVWYYDPEEDAITYVRIEGIRTKRNGKEQFFMAQKWVDRERVATFKQDLKIPTKDEIPF